MSNDREARIYLVLSLDKEREDLRSDIQKPFNLRSSSDGFSKMWFAISVAVFEYSYDLSCTTGSKLTWYVGPRILITR